MTNDFNPFINGNRIYLREVRLSDVNERYYQWMNDPEVIKYMESRFYPNSVEEISEFVRSKTRDKDNAFMAIMLKEDDRHIGNIKLGPINTIHRYADVALIIGEKDCWGKGYATEAICLIVDYAFNRLNLHKLTAGCYEANQGSAKCFQKAGFTIEGCRRNQYFCDGIFVDAILLGMLRKEY